MIGQTIGRYRILKQLGESAAETVYLAEDTFLRREVILELPRDAGARFVEEARAASALAHPGLVTMYDAGEENGQPFVAYEKVEGQTVADLVRGARLPVSRAIRIARQVAEALAHAGSRGVFHHNLTVGSVLVTADDRVKVRGLGLRAMTAGTAGDTDPLRDLGLILREMTAGRSTSVDGVIAKALEEDPAVRFASVDQLAAELTRIESEYQRHVARAIARRRRAARLSAVAIGVLGLAVLATLVQKFGLPRIGPTGPRYDSVAVLPLADGGAGREAILWANAVSEAIATKLTGIEGLRVIPWITSQRYSLDRLPAGIVAAELNVDALVTGEFRVAGEVVSGSVIVLESEEGQELWSETFSEPFERVLEVQSEIGVGVARALRGRLDGDEQAELERSVANSVEAFRLFLEGGALLRGETYDSNREAVAYFERALELDPLLAPAHEGIAAAYRARVFFGWEAGAIAKAEESVTRALEIDPESLRAIEGRNDVWWLQGRAVELLEYARDAAADGERVDALRVRASAYSAGGLTSESLALVRRSAELDPASLEISWELVQALCGAGRFDEGVAAGERFFQTFGEDLEVHIWMGIANGQLGHTDLARLHFERAYALSPPGNMRGAEFLAGFLWAEGEIERSLTVIEPALEQARRVLEIDPEAWIQPILLARYSADPGDLERLSTTIIETHPDNMFALAEVVSNCAERRLYVAAERVLRYCLAKGWWNEGYLHGFTDGFFDRPESADLLEECRATVDALKREYGMGAESTP